MWISGAELERYHARVKELENIICPAEQHDFHLVGEKLCITDGYGTTYRTKRYVCKKCLKEIEKEDII